MKESVLHYVWQHKLYVSVGQKLTNGYSLEVLHPGKLNTDAGPDFFNAQLKIDGMVWAGNVEIHLRSSDWFKHGHQTDPAYDSIILHVVGEADVEIQTSKGEQVLQYVLQYPSSIDSRVNLLMQEGPWVSCENMLKRPEFQLPPAFKDALVYEMLANKYTDIQHLLERSNYHWEEIMYVKLSESFGAPVNSFAFKKLALSIPLRIWKKHSDSIEELEALFLGQAGLIEEEANAERLFLHYRFFASKYHLLPMHSSEWKFLRLRPSSFPPVRIRKFVRLLHNRPYLLQQLLTIQSIQNLQSVFMSDKYIRKLKIKSEKKDKSDENLSMEFVNIQIINAVVPVLFSFARHLNSSVLEEKALSLLNEIPAEDNLIIRKWHESGLTSNNAFDTQAWLFLKKNYCDTKKCLRCRIGYQLLSK